MAAIDTRASLKEEDPQLLFDVIEEIGQGSFGFVYKARHKETGDLVAIKKMLFGGNPKGDEFRDIMKEIQFISSLDHPNTVKHYGSYVKGNYIWMVMEFCLGSASDLLDVFKDGLVERDIAAVIGETCEALAYLHRNNKIHRDIKAANILLTGKGEVKLGDFGSASFTDPANTFVGTPCWIAPEVIMAMESGLYTSKMDVWSLGITCIELAEKKPPLFDMNPMSTLYHIPQNDPPTLSNLNKWSPGFENFIGLCLKKDPAERATIQQLSEHAFVQIGDRKQVLKDLVRKAKHAAEKREREAAKKIEALAKNPGIIVTDTSTPSKSVVDEPSTTPDPSKEEKEKEKDKEKEKEKEKDKEKDQEESRKSKRLSQKSAEHAEGGEPTKKDRKEARKSRESEKSLTTSVESISKSEEDKEKARLSESQEIPSPKTVEPPKTPESPQKLLDDTLSRRLSNKMARKVSLRDMLGMTHSQSHESFQGSRSEYSYSDDDRGSTADSERSLGAHRSLERQGLNRSPSDYIFEGTIKARKASDTADSEKERDREYLKKQLKEFKAFQAQLQKKKAAKIKDHEAESLVLKRAQEREMELFNKTQIGKLEKLTSKNKKELEDFLKEQAKELKAFEEEMAKRRKIELAAHLSEQKKIVKEKEKEHKEKRNEVPKVERQLLKESQETELDTWKEQNTREYNLRVKEREHEESKKFHSRQLEELQARKLKAFLEEFELRKETKELLHQKKIKLLEVLQANEMSQTTQIHELERDHQDKTCAFTEAQLLENHRRYEKDLKKYQSLELKKHPKHLKTITSTLKKELADTVKSQKKRHSILEKQLNMEETPKDEKKKILDEFKADQEKAITLHSLRYEKKISEVIEYEITQLDLHQQRQAQELQAKQDKQRKEMENYHEFRRKGLEKARADQIAKLNASNERALAELKRELAIDMQSFLDHHQELRKSLEANQAAERATHERTFV